jgi:hypothetical protein
MARVKKSGGKRRPSSSRDDATAETFIGLNINSNGSEPMIRNAGPANGKPSERKQKEARETLRKVERDMTRSVLKEVSKALANPSE